MKLKKYKTKKKVKPASKAQKNARERNWNKALITGINSTANKLYKSKTTFDSEKKDLGIIIEASKSLIQNWNK